MGQVRVRQQGLQEVVTWKAHILPTGPLCGADSLVWIQPPFALSARRLHAVHTQPSRPHTAALPA